MSQEIKKLLIAFVVGLLVAFIIVLLLKPKDKDLSTIFEIQQNEEQLNTAVDEIEEAQRQRVQIQTKRKEQKRKNDEVFNNGLTDAEYDSIIWAIDEKSRKADSIEDIRGLQ